MKDPEFGAFIKKERQRLVGFVRALLRDASELDPEDVVHDVLVRLLGKPNLELPLACLFESGTTCAIAGRLVVPSPAKERCLACTTMACRARPWWHGTCQLEPESPSAGHAPGES